MSDRANRRKFMLTSHGALHKPGCPRLKRLKVPPEEVWYDPGYLMPSDTFPASCCWYYSSVTPAIYGWEYNESKERLKG